MAGNKVGYGKWIRRKIRGTKDYQWIWKYERPFKEWPMWDSRATVSERGVMEIWYVIKPEGIANERTMADKVRNGLRELFNVEGKDICEVMSMIGFARVAYYCRMKEPPKEDVMRKVEDVIASSYVETEVSRWDAKTGEYQGTFLLTEFDPNARFEIMKHIEGSDPKKFNVVRGSKWRLAN